MKTIVEGMTGAEFITALNNIEKIYNVKDYGALGNGADDDTVAIQTTINTCITAGGGIVYFPNGIYKVGGALQTNVGGVNPNCQLYIPARIKTDASRCTIQLLGESIVSGSPVTTAAIWGPIASQGVIIKSTLTSASGTKPSVFGTKTSDGWTLVEIGFKNIVIHVEALIATTGPVLNGINGTDMLSLRIENCAVSIDDFIANSILPDANVTGIIIGLCDCATPNLIKDTTVMGFKNGVISGEHTFLNGVTLYNCETALIASAGNYTTTASHLIIHRCKYGIGFVASALYGGNLNAQLSIALMEVETEPSEVWYKTLSVINDASNKLFGELRYQVCESGTAGNDNTKFTKTGGGNLRCYPVYLPTASFTLSGADTDAKVASIIAVLKANGLAV